MKILLFAEAGPQRWFFDELSFLSEQQFESKDTERAQTLVKLHPTVSPRMHEIYL